MPPGDDRRRVAVVTTTIRLPRFIEPLLDSARRFDRLGQTGVIVVGDRKTPADCGEYLGALARRFGVEIVYLDPAAQRAMLRAHPALDMVLRWDCVQRRNVGFLRAGRDGAEVIVSIDDDNFPTDDDFIGHHLVVGREVEVPVVGHTSGWWNVCRRLVCDPPRRFYHRGYPKSQQDWRRDESDEGLEIAVRRVRVAANAGLWLGAPDADATAQIEEPIRVVAMEPVAGSRSCALKAGTWCPMNTQNTAFDAALLPAMYLPVMLDPVRGYRIDRADDIWMSYFLRAIADHRGESVVYGPPLVHQQRNPHDHLRDLAGELAAYRLTEHLVGYLRAFRSDAADCGEAYLDLIHHLREAAEADAALETPEREYFRKLTIGMAAWQEAVDGRR
jgi:hypothetical protein